MRVNLIYLFGSLKGVGNMNNNKLSPINILIGANLNEIIYNLYGEFHKIFIKKDSRPLFKNKFIFFNMNRNYKGQILTYPERFMHICSIEDKEDYTIFPCNNDITYSLCRNKCLHHKALTDFQKIGRTECTFRMSRIHWIPEIINLFNEGSVLVKNWQKPQKNKYTNRIENYEFIRYEDEINDYVVILKEDKNKMGGIEKYSFITAYPVFFKRNKRDFDFQYKRYNQLNKKNV
jgi:hypothetical protein